MSGENETLSCTPPLIKEVAENVSLNLLPTKSRMLYEKAYKDFSKWCSDNEVVHYSENALLAYFGGLSEQLQSSTLWSKYSMLKATIIVKNNINMANYAKLISFLKRKSEGYKPKKSKILTREQIYKFLAEAPDEVYLMIKVVLIFGVAGACRSDEMVRLLTKDVQDLQTTILVTLRETKTRVDRVFTINCKDGNPINFVELCRKYLGLRKALATSNETVERFFVLYRNNKCCSQPVGKNTFGKIPQKIATYLNPPEPSLYTGHCFRRSSASLLADAGASINVLKRHGGWKSSTVAEGYVENSFNNKRKIAEQILSDEIQQPATKKPTAQPSTSTVSHDVEMATINSNISNYGAVVTSTVTSTATSPVVSPINTNEPGVTINLPDKKMTQQVIPPLFNITNCKDCNISVNVNINK